MLFHAFMIVHNRHCVLFFAIFHILCHACSEYCGELDHNVCQIDVLDHN